MFYFIYESKETSTMPIAQVEKLAKEAAKKNASFNITGLLVRKNNGFLQYLEGPKKAITLVYKSILRDRRHHCITILKKDYINKRKFDRWSMLLKNITSEEIKKIETLKTKNSKFLKKINEANNNNLNLILDLIKTLENLN